MRRIPRTPLCSRPESRGTHDPLATFVKTPDGCRHTCTFSLWPVSYNYLINTDSAIFPFQVSRTAPINNPSKRTKSTVHGSFFKYIENRHSLLLDVSSVENFPVLILGVSAPLIPAVVDSPQMGSSQAETYWVFCSWGYQSRTMWRKRF